MTTIINWGLLISLQIFIITDFYYMIAYIHVQFDHYVYNDAGFESKKHKITHWGRGKMAAISHTTFSNAFSWFESIEL